MDAARERRPTTLDAGDVLSPELVLVDPDLRLRARALLAERERPEAPDVLAGAAAQEALRRLVEASIASDFLPGR